MNMSQELRLILLIAAAFAIGAAVCLLQPTYRFKENLESNWNYYPSAAGESTEHAPMMIELTPLDSATESLELKQEGTGTTQIEPMNPVEF